MAKYFWELDLSAIPLGWQEVYDKALQDCPNGTNNAMNVSAIDNGAEEISCWYNPVACRELLLAEFNKYKTIAANLYAGANKENFQSTAINLLKADVRLWTIVSYWVYDEYDGSDFNDTDVSAYIMSPKMDSYFSPEESDYMKPYEEYKFFRNFYLESNFSKF